MSRRDPVHHAPWLALAMSLLSCAHGSPAAAPTSTAPARAALPGPIEQKAVWRSENRVVRAELVLIGGATPRCLLRVAGTGEESDGHVFACMPVGERKSMEYWVPWKGRRLRLLALDQRRTVVRPGWGLGELRVTPDEQASASLDAEALFAAHLEAERAGTLARLGAFDRAWDIANQESGLVASRALLEKSCGSDLGLSVDWQASSEADLRRHDMGDACATVAEGIASLCENPAGRDFVREHVKALRCGPLPAGADPEAPGSMALAGGRFTYTVGVMANLQQSTIEFLAGQGQHQPSAMPGPWADGTRLRDQMMRESMLVCGDEKGRVVALGPDSRRTMFTIQRHEGVNLFVGTRTALVEVTRARGWEDGYLYPGRTVGFVDPRQPPDPELPRFISTVTMDEGSKSCTVRCGPRKVTLPALERAEAQQVLRDAKRSGSPFTRRPHALLRDTTGTYYYVDTSTLPGREKDFRVFVGKRGALKLLPMSNALSDSEGELFTTKQGDLRLTLDRKQPSFWLAGKKKVELRLVPVDENLDVIFVELGVYAAERLGTPCDDF